MSVPGFSDREICKEILIPLSPNIHIQILQTDFHAFPLRICLENLMKDLRFFPLLIILVSLVTFSLDYGIDIIEGKYFDVGHIILCKVIVEILPAFSTPISSDKTKLFEFAFQTTSSWN